MGSVYFEFGACLLLTTTVAVTFVRACDHGDSQEDSRSQPLQFPQLPTINEHLMEIYNGDHFADLAFDKTEKFRLATLLVLYEAPCQEKALSLGMFDRQALPPVTYLNYMTHDYVAWKEKSWFQLSEKQDLAALYSVSSCPTALFWGKGAVGNTLPVRWTTKQPVSFKEWVASQMVCLVRLVNERSEEVDFLLPGNGESVLVAAHSQTYVSVRQPWQGPVIARNPQSLDIVDALPIVSNGQYLTVRENSFTSGDWTHLITEQLELWDDAKFFRADTRARHLLIIEQPPRLQNFTENGFTLQRLPVDVLDHLLSLYTANSPHMQKQKMRKHQATCASVLNDEETEMYLVEVPPEDATFVISQIQDLAEKWCKCRLRNSRGVRFRRYHKGSRVRMHLDVNNSTSSDRMIGAVFQIHQDLQGARDWEFSVIGPDGQWRRLNNTPGDLILFEPSLIPHGRPRPLQGETFLNGFVHFDAQFGIPGKDEL